MIIGIDCDEVLREFCAALIKRYKKDFPARRVLPITKYELNTSFPDGPNMQDYFCSKGIAEEIYLGADLVPGAREFIWQLRLRGHRVHVVTCQPRKGEVDPCPLTMEWFARNQIPWDDMSFVKDKWKVDCDLYLDDSLYHLEPLRDHGKKAIAMDRPWNQDWAGDRIHNFDEFYKYLEQL
jgi:hypothetical protein